MSPVIRGTAIDCEATVQSHKRILWLYMTRPVKEIGMQHPLQKQDKTRYISLLFILCPTIVVLMLCLPSFARADEESDFKRARAAVTSGRLLEAQSLLEDLIDRYPTGRRLLETKYLLGRVLYRRADYDAAAGTFSEIIEKQRGWQHADETVYGMAMAQIGMLDYGGAIQSLEMLMALYPQSEIAPEALYWLGEAMYRRARYANALEQFNQFLVKYPDHALREYAFDSAASCLEQSGEYFKAIDTRHRFLTEFPDTLLKGRAEFCLATDYLEIGNRYEAARHYVQAESASPSSPLGEKALLRAGILISETDRTEESIQVLEKLLARGPGAEVTKTARLALGTCYLRSGDYVNAERTSRALLKTPLAESERCAVSFQLSLAQMGLEKFDRAAAGFSDSIRRDTCNALQKPSALLLATCLLHLDRPTASAEALRSLLDVMPASEHPPDLLFALAGSLVLSHRFADAQPFLAALSSNSEATARWPQVVYYDGFCLFWMSKYDRASERFEQFIAMGKPTDLVPLATYMKANSLLRAGRLAEATRSYELFLGKWANDPMAVSALYQNGLAHLILGEHDTAASVLERLIIDYPSAPAATPARYFLGISRMKRGNNEGAAEMFRFLSTEHPTFELSDRAAFALGWIEFLKEDYATAGEVFKALPRRFPHTRLADRAAFLAAATDYRLGLPEVASAGFRKIPDLLPKSPLSAEASLWAALCEEELNHPENALALYRQAFEASDHSDERAYSLFGIGWSEMNLGDRDAAAEAFGELINEYPTHPMTEQAYFWKGRLDYAGGRWKIAADDLMQLTRVFPMSELVDDSIFFAARASRRAEDYALAIELFQSIGRRFPESALAEKAYLEAAQCLIEAGMADGAAREFETFIADNVDSPLRPLALYDMGRALQRAGKFEEANEQYRVAAAGNKTELAARSHFAIAECLAELDRSGEAIAELVGIARGGFPAGWAERAQLQMARLLERDGRIDEARLIYDNIAETYIDDAAGMVAVKAVERLNRDRTGAAVP